MSRSAERALASQSLMDVGKSTWRDYYEITKPGINKSNLLATFTGFWLASGFQHFDFLNLLWTLLGTALVIAGGCVLNNFYDRDIDPKMNRTETRAVPEGRIKPIVALWYGIFLSLAGFIVLGVLVNAVAAFLGFVGFFVYVMIYTMWLKRTSVWNTVVGGVSGAVPPMIGWVAVTGRIDLTAWALFLVLFMWQPPHFFALAMRRVEEYRAAGIPMLPVIKGFAETKIQTLLFTLLLLPSSLLLFFTGASGWVYLTAATILGVVYIILSIKGFYAKDDIAWAKMMFIYSLIYLMGILLVIVIDKGITSFN
ncbi:protoheme IX farnesyltransferase [Thermoactinomyces sp. DSM 45891]|uniref:heme o synthase n=1 Tax=Thermoactinomyces sp. DSM 45891 TaxID=1761907 RepID=UPI00091DB00C|nr:heme o synthase [Thermoactinomyces sp. DSM 45891]SFX68015.1 protoheme IX farnesyltransferase [Thermoactinomyces sp. DSM 45891]